MPPVKLRLAFMGTPDFAVPTLEALVEAGHEVVAVYTQPPRAAGRGKKPRPSPVQHRAEELGLEVRAPLNFRDEADRRAFAALGLDAAVVAAYGLILPRAILEAPRFGCLNVHASLLPRWRGAAPIQRAVMAGDSETGISIMQVEAGLDAGPVLAVERTTIGPDDTAAALHDRLAAIGARLMVEVLDGLAAGRLTAVPQAEEDVTYAAKIDKAEARIDWTRPADEIERLIRALSPFPGAWFELEGERIKVHRAHRVLIGPPDVPPPGTTLTDDLVVRCGDGYLRLETLQRAGRGPMDAASFLRGRPVPAGTALS